MLLLFLNLMLYYELMLWLSVYKKKEGEVEEEVRGWNRVIEIFKALCKKSP